MTSPPRETGGTERHEPFSSSSSSTLTVLSNWFMTYQRVVVKAVAWLAFTNHGPQRCRSTGTHRCTTYLTEYKPLRNKKQARNPNLAPVHYSLSGKCRQRRTTHLTLTMTRLRRRQRNKKEKKQKKEKKRTINLAPTTQSTASGMNPYFGHLLLKNNGERHHHPKF